MIVATIVGFDGVLTSTTTNESPTFGFGHGWPLRHPCAATYAYEPETATPYAPKRLTGSWTEPMISGCAGFVLTSRIVRLLPVPSSLLFVPEGPLRFLLTTYAYPPTTFTVEAFTSELAEALVPAITGWAGFERSRAVRLPGKYPVVYA